MGKRNSRYLLVYVDNRLSNDNPKFFYPLPNKPLFLRVCGPSLLKTLWKMEKLLETSNFSFTRSVFYQVGELSAIVIEFEIVVSKRFQFDLEESKICRLGNG